MVSVFWSPLNDKQFVSVELERYKTTLNLHSIENNDAESTGDSNHVPTRVNKYTFLSDIESILVSSLVPNILVGSKDGKILQKSIADFTRDEEVMYESRGCVQTLSRNRNIKNHIAVGYSSLIRDSSSLCILDTDYSKFRKIVEFLPGESTYSVEFLEDNDYHSLIAGSGLHKTGKSSIKLIYYKDKKGVKQSKPTKSIHGICVDPFDPNRFASYGDHSVCIWDKRHLDNPIYNQSESKPISKIDWCPNRSGFLGVLSKDCYSLKIYDIQSQTNGTLESFTRSIQAGHRYRTFAWHQKHDRKILLSYEEGTFEETHIYERKTLNWSASNCLVWSSGKNNLRSIVEREQFHKEIGDISVLIKERALKQYGLYSDKLSQNGKVTEDEDLQRLWLWLDEVQAKKLKEGISKVLASSSNRLQSNEATRYWVTTERSSHRGNGRKLFESVERSNALRMCSWPPFQNEDCLIPFLRNLEKKGKLTQAAEVAVMNLNLREAVNILKRGFEKLQDATLSAAAMAVAGFTNEPNALWKDTCTSLIDSICDPYLKAVCLFLLGTTEAFNAILKDDQILLNDRVAFACLYLPDNKILQYLNDVKLSVVQEGDLSALWLTGLQDDGQSLLQNYLNVTSDIQTPALIAVHLLPELLHVDQNINNWLQCYRDLLDSLQLWKERAKLDIICKKKTNRIGTPSEQHKIYMMCNRDKCKIGVPCMKNERSHARPNPAQNCHKFPLHQPVCAICLQHMKDYPQKDLDISSKRVEPQKKQVRQFNTWFSWCNTCRHGGHTMHMMQWFKSHKECPVHQCNCQCMMADNIYL